MNQDERSKTIEYCNKVIHSVPLNQLQITPTETIEETEDYLELLMWTIEDFDCINKQKLARRIMAWEMR